MRNLILFIIKNKDHFVFFIAIILSLTLLFNNKNEEMSVVRGFATDSDSEPRGDLDGNEPVVNPPVFGGGQYDASFNYKKYKKDRTRIEKK